MFGRKTTQDVNSDKELLLQAGELGKDVPYEKLVTTEYSKKAAAR